MLQISTADAPAKIALIIVSGSCIPVEAAKLRLGTFPDTIPIHRIVLLKSEEQLNTVPDVNCIL